MSKYNIIDKNNRNVILELKEYTFEELKAYFEPNKEELPEYWKKWNDIEDIIDLEFYLNEEYYGMEQPYLFEELN